jgi:adenine-specific DNA-methyltransferase
MNHNVIKIKDSLNKAYLKLQPTRSQIETFKENFVYLFKQIRAGESEEFHKNEISEFLKKTYYAPDHYVNTKGRYDLVLHNGKDSSSSVGVIIETKSPGNVSEMPSTENINAKAVRELILYYLRERITNKNLELKHLITTNLYEWFIFDAHDFEKYFADNKTLVKQFTDFEEGRSSGKDTSFFYNSIAAPIIDSLASEIKFTHFDLRDYEKIISNNNREDDNSLIPLYKILSPEHLLKIQFKNDSNSLDKDFYRELLHIIGLEETKQGSKKLIGRAGEKTRNYGSLVESAISILNTEDCISQIPRPTDFGEIRDEQLFNISLELVITWINRILFLKLLEGQLVKYNHEDKGFRFLDQSLIPDYDALNKLFFQVLAIPEAERDHKLKERFKIIPYLNSSLFEPTELERRTIRISNLDNDNKLPVHKGTVLKDNLGKRITGENHTLKYLFEFLDAYNFSSEGGKGIQEENKTLINASVLGLIFEKINGYKDGSFFTPGFITQYMCHETITRAVVQKFNEIKGWTCETLIDVNNKIENKQEANNIINSLRICDPAVGSGHFLVSALNEIISIKSDLKILVDREGKVLRDYHFEVINDELIISDPEGEPFEYNPKNRESQRVQEAIFHEKQTIIENCLFGVDINPNSVKICRLRLWIELLKNAYYKPGENHRELETLPNIDINIKCGNSLVSRYPLDADIRTALKSSKWTIDNYREAVMLYRNAESKEQKRTMEKLISEIKSNFESEVSKSDKRFIKLNKISGELLSMTTQKGLFELGKKEKDEWNKKVNKLVDEQKALEQQLEEIGNNKIYENAFEWRFEFPEVLNNEGEFIGFDVVIGNPPYIRQETLKDIKPFLRNSYKTYTGATDLYVFFVERGFEVLKESGQFCYIMPNKWMQSGYGRPLRSFLINHQVQFLIDFGDLQVFDEATTYPLIILASKSCPIEMFHTAIVDTLKSKNDFKNYVSSIISETNFSSLDSDTWVIKNNRDTELLAKINSNSITLAGYVNGNAKRGIVTGLSEAFVIDKVEKDRFIKLDPKNEAIIKPLLQGRNLKPYTFIEPEKYLLFIPWHFPLHNEDGITGASIIAEEAFKEQYTSVWVYLCQFKEKLMSRNKAETGIRYEWYALQRYASDYFNDFEKPKIMFQVFQVKPCFIYDERGLFCNNSIWFLPSADKALLGILNSKMGWWLISKYCSAIQNGYQLIWEYFSKIPIPIMTTDLSRPLINVVDQILALKKSEPNSNTKAYEDEIDRLVYRLYNLSKEEIALVES